MKYLSHKKFNSQAKYKKIGFCKPKLGQIWQKLGKNYKIKIKNGLFETENWAEN